MAEKVKNVASIADITRLLKSMDSLTSERKSVIYEALIAHYENSQFGATPFPPTA